MNRDRQEKIEKILADGIHSEIDWESRSHCEHAAKVAFNLLTDSGYVIKKNDEFHCIKCKKEKPIDGRIRNVCGDCVFPKFSLNK